MAPRDVGNLKAVFVDLVSLTSSGGPPTGLLYSSIYLRSYLSAKEFSCKL